MIDYMTAETTAEGVRYAPGLACAIDDNDMERTEATFQVGFALEEFQTTGVRRYTWRCLVDECRAESGNEPNPSGWTAGKAYHDQHGWKHIIGHDGEREGRNSLERTPRQVRFLEAAQDKYYAIRDASRDTFDKAHEAASQLAGSASQAAMDAAHAAYNVAKRADYDKLEAERAEVPTIHFDARIRYTHELAYVWECGRCEWRKGGHFTPEAALLSHDEHLPECEGQRRD